MEDYYLWNSELPRVHLGDYRSPFELLEALRLAPLDRFSTIVSLAEEEAFTSAGAYMGYGVRLGRDADGSLVLLEVYAESAAGRAGLVRGDRVVAIDGQDTAALLATDSLGEVLGPNEAGWTVTFTIKSAAGGERDVVVTKGSVAIPSLSKLDEPIDVAGTPVAYLHLRAFNEPAIAALKEAFAELATAGVRDVILDLRYNGGGLVTVAVYLGDLLGGLVAEGQVFSRMLFNPDHSDLNSESLFIRYDESIDLERLVVITSAGTASASEMVINGMFPFVDVTMVGATTFGKPVGSLGFVFCDYVFRPISFELANADFEGQYFAGLQPDCPANDEVDAPLGDPSEASLAEALYVVEHGSCSPAASGRSQHRAVHPLIDPIEPFIGAH
jgi:hypothetical protein